jgi:Tfp pilus assembly protein PilO
MTSYLDKLNLRPFEKRLVVGVAAVLFVVFNAWFVFPHFSDLSQTEARKADALKKMQKWQVEVDQIPKYRRMVADIIGTSQDVAPEDQQYQFSSAIQMQQAQSGVNITSFGRPTTSTNEFFVKLTQTIGVQGGEDKLVDFLYSLAAGKSLIRVRGLTLHTDPPKLNLVASVTLVASYQKNPPKKTAPAVATAAGGRPASSAATKP